MVWLNVLFIVLFFISTIAIGIYARKHAGSVGSFVLGGRSVGPWLSAFAYGTTYFSAVVFIGYAGQFGWSFGISTLWIGIGNAFIGSYLVWRVMGRRTRIMTKHLEATTMPEFFGKRYDSKALKIAASAIVFVFLIPYSASVFNGLSYLFQKALGLEDVKYGFEMIIIGMCLLTAAYVILGGYMSTAINDFFQGVIMLVGIVLVIAAALNVNGGFMSSITQLSNVPQETGIGGVFASFFGPKPLDLLGVVILTSIGVWGLPQMVHKFYAIKDEKAIQTGTIISTVFALVIAGGSYFLGSFGRLFVDNSKVPVEIGFDRIVPTMLMNDGIPKVLLAIVVVLVLSASLSTLSSLVLTSSSTLTLDFVSGTVVKDMTEKKKVLWIRIFIAIFILVSMCLAIYSFQSKNLYITKLMSISWGALAGSFLAPFLYGLFWKKVTRAAVWANFACGVGITVTHLILSNGDMFGHSFKFPTDLPINLASPINAGSFAMLFGLIVVPVVSLLTPKLEKKTVDHAFEGYDIAVAASQKTILPADKVI
jgi:SSS family solute:Na+ symporter